VGEREEAVLIGLASALAAVAMSVGAAAPPAPVLPPVGVDWDYQLGGPRPVPDHVGIVERDRHAEPAASAYGVCYVNGFQTQAEEKRFWRDPRRWSLVLKDGRGRPVVDEAWGEWLLDLRTARKRERLATIVGRWTAGCADDGYDAVEYDNLDSWTRSHRLLTARQAKAYARLLVAGAHAVGLAAAQKNWAGMDGRALGYDFVVAEECGRWRECGEYVDDFGRRVLAVEYRDADLTWTCRRYAGRISVVRRDLDLSPTGVRRWC
jgi:hypothetical protein